MKKYSHALRLISWKGSYSKLYLMKIPQMRLNQYTKQYKLEPIPNGASHTVQCSHVQICSCCARVAWVTGGLANGIRVLASKSGTTASTAFSLVGRTFSTKAVTISFKVTDSQVNYNSLSNNCNVLYSNLFTWGQSEKWWHSNVHLTLNHNLPDICHLTFKSQLIYIILCDI